MARGGESLDRNPNGCCVVADAPLVTCRGLAVQSLFEMNSDAQNQLTKAIYREKLRHVEALLQSGADVNGVDSKGWTPLMQAVEMENVDIVRLLLSRGADVNLRGSGGVTPLHIAVDISIDGTIQTGGQPGDEPTEIIELLLQKGGFLLARDAKGETPLDWALNYRSRKIADLLQAWQEKAI